MSSQCTPRPSVRVITRDLTGGGRPPPALWLPSACLRGGGGEIRELKLSVDGSARVGRNGRRVG